MGGERPFLSLDFVEPFLSLNFVGGWHLVGFDGEESRVLYIHTL